MFLLLQFIGAVCIILGVWFVFGKLLRKDSAMVAGLCAFGLLSAVLSGVLLATIPMPAETVYIEALNGAVALKNVTIVDGKTHTIFELIEGKWQFVKKEKVYRWNREVSEKDPSITARIAVKVPVGGGRGLVFLSDESSGHVAVSCGEERKEYDLYSAEAKERKVWLPDSDAVYDDLVKLGRLAVYGLMTVCGVMLAALFLSKVRGENLRKVLCGVCAVFTTMSFYLSINLVDRSGDSLPSLLLDFFQSFRTDELILPLVIAPLLYKAFLFCMDVYCEGFATAKGTACIAVPAVVFSSFMVMGNAFVSNGTLRPIFGNELQVLKGLFQWLGYFSLFFFGIVWIFHYLENHSVCGESSAFNCRLMRAYEAAVKRRPFAVTMLLLMAVYLPLLVISYPGFIMGDTPYQLAQVFDLRPLSNAHPFAHTLFMGWLLKAGNWIFGSINAGLFLCTIVQLLLLLITISAVVCFLESIQVKPTILLLLTLYYMVCPQIQNFALLMTKDVLNGAFLLAFMVALYALLTNRRSKYTCILLGLSSLGALLFRHDSKYIIILTIILLFVLLKEHRKFAIIFGTSVLCAIVFWDNAVLPRVIPTAAEDGFQAGMEAVFMSMQTARYLRDAGGEVTTEEMEAISAYFDVDRMMKGYQPDGVSDAVTRSAIGETADTWNAYQKAWLQMFLKHPEIYAEATLQHKYEYMYPKLLLKRYDYTYSWSKQQMEMWNEWGAEGVNGKLEYPELLNGYVERYSTLRKAFFHLPLANVLFTTSVYFWIMFVWLFYCIFRRNRLAIVVMGPLLFYVLVLLGGPTNGGYYRYIFPYYMALFVVIVLGLSVQKKEREKC